MYLPTAIQMPTNANLDYWSVIQLCPALFAFLGWSRAETVISQDRDSFLFLKVRNNMVGADQHKTWQQVRPAPWLADHMQRTMFFQHHITLHLVSISIFSVALFTSLARYIASLYWAFTTMTTVGIYVAPCLAPRDCGTVSNSWRLWRHPPPEWPRKGALVDYFFSVNIKIH